MGFLLVYSAKSPSEPRVFSVDDRDEKIWLVFWSFAMTWENVLITLWPIFSHFTQKLVSHGPPAPSMLKPCWCYAFNRENLPVDRYCFLAESCPSMNQIKLTTNFYQFSWNRNNVWTLITMSLDVQGDHLCSLRGHHWGVLDSRLGPPAVDKP